MAACLTTKMLFANTVTGLISVFLLSVAVGGERPTISRISPPGGQLGTTVDAKLIGKVGDGQLKFWSRAGQLQIVSDKEKPADVSIRIPADATPGIHWVRIHNEYGTSEMLPLVVGLVPEFVESESNNRLPDAQVIDGSSATINGVLEQSADVDVFAVPLKANQTLVASVLANRILGSPMDAVLQVLSPSGVVVAQIDDDHALDPQIAFTASKAGTYFVRIFAFPAAPNSTIRLASAATYVYRLTLTTEGFVDFAIPAVVDGTSETQVTLHGWNLPGNRRKILVSPQRPESFLVTNQLAESLDVPRSAVLSLTDDYMDADLEFPCSVSGQISEAKQTDAFCFAGSKGQKLTFAVQARGLYSLLDPVVRIRKESGSLVKEADDISRQNLDCQVNVTLPADGRYTVEVTDRYDSGGERHFYVLSCEQTSASVTASVAATSYTLNSDKPAEIPVSVNRLNSFSKQVNFSIQGLPDGVMTEDVVSEAKGDSAKTITLKINASVTAKPFSGLVSVVGRSGNSSIPVTAKIPNSTQVVDSFWLTVTPSATVEPVAKANSDQ